MHELACATEIFRKLKKIATQKNIKKVSMIKLSIGKASGIAPDFLIHSFRDHLFEGGEFSGADVIIETEEPYLICKSCGAKVTKDFAEVSIILKECQVCKGAYLALAGGNDIKIISVEGEKIE